MSFIQDIAGLDKLFKKTINQESSKIKDPSLGFQDSNLQKSIILLKEALLKNYRIDIGFTSNCITSGCRNIIKELCRRKIVDSIVTTAGAIEEDIIQVLDGEFKNITLPFDDKKLYQLGYFRSGNRIARSEGYIKLEYHLQKKLDSFKKKTISTSELIKKIKLKGGYLYELPAVYCPCIEDGAIGDYIYLRARRGLTPLLITYTKDHIKYQESILQDSRRKLAIILGGSIPKHYVLNSSIIAGGYDSVILLNTGLHYDGSNAGAEPEEAYSWGKVSAEGNIVKIFGDFTITFPLLLEKTGILI
jgi:deoxyhypusine synthase